ncbi:zeta toxin family protein [Chitinophaga sp. S165]|uniref:zeta toxin family protein n=1 Tax=Chitinophaga sp. S165 TaxID=2135462 RepID=UPI000D856C55|nr:zeta toxin family protein [Chitinophaga sp. S165]PWV49822.1 zeta toxin [Chitinophaga sp. S165]
MPTLYIIAGSNGAGKSSTGPGLLPEAVISKHPPFDGDKLKSIKQLEFRKQVGGSWKEAGRLADEYVYEEFERQYKYAIQHSEDFVYEGHFTEENSWELIRTFKNKGYVYALYGIRLCRSIQR